MSQEFREKVNEGAKEASRSTRPDMTTVFHAWVHCNLQRHKATLEERNFIERIKAPIFLEAVLAIEIM